MRKILLLQSLLMLFVISASAQNYKFGKVSKEEVLQKEHPLQKDANAAVLFRSQEVYYDLSQNDGFSLVTEVHERIKIYNKEGFDWATKKIRKYIGKSDEENLTQLKGYTYNLIDGKLEEEKLRDEEVFEEDESKYRRVTKFTMPAVTEGSVIEYTYRIKSPFLGHIGKTPLQYTIPIDRIELKVKIPEYFFFSKYQNLRSPLNFKLDETTKNANHTFSSINRNTNRYTVQHSSSNNKLEYLMNIYALEKENIPALKKETHVDNLHTYAAFIDWELQYTKFPNSTITNYSETWEGVARSIYKDIGIGQELDKDGFYDEELEALIAGLSDPMMKTEKIFSFVKKKVKWNDYLGFFPETGTKKAYKEGSGNIGDINLLLISMLRYAKLKAHPVLLSTPSNGIPVFPTRDGFNYVVAGIEIGDKMILLDASDPTAGIGELPERARNWQGRLIREEGNSEWINLMPKYQSEKIINVNLKLDKNNASGLYRTKYTGLFAKEFREKSFSSNGEYKLEDRLDGKAAIEIAEYKLENKSKLGSEIIESCNLELDGVLELIGDKAYLKPMFFEAIQENPFKESTRTYPIFFDFPEKTIYSINILVPDGYKVISLPESSVVNLGNDDGQFKFILNANGTVIRLISHISFNKTVFNPEEYDYLKKFYANIIKKHSEAIVLEKTTENGNSERAESGR